MSTALTRLLGRVPGEVRGAGGGEAEDGLGVPQQGRAAHHAD